MYTFVCIYLLLRKAMSRAKNLVCNYGKNKYGVKDHFYLIISSHVFRFVLCGGRLQLFVSYQLSWTQITVECQKLFSNCNGYQKFLIH